MALPMLKNSATRPGFISSCSCPIAVGTAARRARIGRIDLIDGPFPDRHFRYRKKTKEIGIREIGRFRRKEGSDSVFGRSRGIPWSYLLIPPSLRIPIVV